MCDKRGSPVRRRYPPRSPSARTGTMPAEAAREPHRIAARSESLAPGEVKEEGTLVVGAGPGSGTFPRPLPRARLRSGTPHGRTPNRGTLLVPPPAPSALTAREVRLGHSASEMDWPNPRLPKPFVRDDESRPLGCYRLPAPVPYKKSEPISMPCSSGRRARRARLTPRQAPRRFHELGKWRGAHTQSPSACPEENRRCAPLLAFRARSYKRNRVFVAASAKRKRDARDAKRGGYSWISRKMRSNLG
jgi:hypothetical protein